ncbi:MAG: nickel pincer cofactor biosynthesis protein LarB [Anaerolineae bacterium]|nr:nickel pincer cofactor biosynthesis protein LarB [Anaerolineae bacterium]
MDINRIQETLEAYRRGDLTTCQAVDALKQLPYETIGQYAQVDHHRSLRTGFPEVIFSQGKTPEQIVQIFKRLAAQNDRVLATRLQPEVYEEIRERLPEAVYHAAARALYLDRRPDAVKREGIVAITAGTADVPVAEEAALTAELMGNAVQRVYDVGVSGLHRLLDHLAALQKARVLIVVAGMEGALPSVVGGLVSGVVIAVPTSVGYGASFGGLAALLAMLNSCASGVAVMNIDNGYGAGVLASRINRLGQEE